MDYNRRFCRNLKLIRYKYPFVGNRFAYVRFFKLNEPTKFICYESKKINGDICCFICIG